MSGIVGTNAGRSSGKVGTVAIGADAITGDEIADDVLDSEHYVAASIDNEHLADDAVGTDEIADNAVTLAKMAGGTDGNIISFDASGNPVAVATGNDGQVLTSAGAGAVCAFEDAGGGGVWVLIGTQTASSDSSLTQTGLDVSTYTKHLIVLSGFVLSATAKLEFLWGPSGGILTSGYSYNTRAYAQNSDAGIDGVGSSDGGSTAHVDLGGPNASASTDHADCEIGLYQKSGVDTHCSGFFMQKAYRGIFGGTNTTTTATTQVRVEPASGNITSGRMTVWGLGHA